MQNVLKKYSVPMAAGLAYNYAAKQVDDDVLEGLKKLAKKHSLLKNTQLSTMAK